MTPGFNKKTVAAAAGTLLLAAGLLYFYFLNPADDKNLYISCTFKNLTGWDCPGCGGQRALHRLLHFDFLGAFRYNALFVILSPYALILTYYTARQYFIGKNFPKKYWFSGKMVIFFLLLLLVFMVVRNLPFFPFTLLSTDN